MTVLIFNSCFRKATHGINVLMPNPRNTAFAAELLENRPDFLSLEDPLASFIGDDPSPSRLTSAALALANPRILSPYVDTLLCDPSGTTFGDTPAFMLVSKDREGGEVESLHALTIARGNQWDARLHVWNEGRRLTEDLHTHRSAFGSVILAGAFRDEVFIRAKPGEGAKMLEWRYDQIEPLGEVAMRSMRQRTFAAGEFHTMPHTLIHSAQVKPKGLSATVVVRRQRDSTSHGFTAGPRTTTFPTVVPVDGAETLRRLRSTLQDV
jgi:hypothetical protein